jgi:hypothetical protein
MTEEWSVDC